MSTALTDDAIGKTVVDAQNQEVGVVTATEHGTARVEPDPDLTDTIKATLGWEDADKETFPLQKDAIATVTDDEVWLKYERHPETSAEEREPSRPVTAVDPEGLRWPPLWSGRASDMGPLATLQPSEETDSERPREADSGDLRR